MSIVDLWPIIVRNVADKVVSRLFFYIRRFQKLTILSQKKHNQLTVHLIQDWRGLGIIPDPLELFEKCSGR